MGAGAENAHSTGSVWQDPCEVPRILTSREWTATELGPMATWPQSLRTIVDLMLAARVPMALVWGSRATLLYNDTFCHVLGTRHPSLLGSPIAEALGETAGSPDHQRLIHEFCSSLHAEAEAPKEFSCSPIRDESGNLIGAMAILTQTAPSGKGQPLRESQHRLKNTLQLIASLMNLQASELQDREVLAPFEEARNRVHSIAALHDFIYASQQYDAIDMAELTRRLVPDVVSLYNCGERIQVTVQAEAAILDAERAVPFGLLLHELVSSSCRHAFPAGSRGELRIRVGREGECNFLSLAHSGPDIPPEMNPEGGTALPARLIPMFVRQLGGELRIQPGPGGHIQVRFPAPVQKQENHL